MLLSFLRRTARRLFPIDAHTARGEPHPRGRKGRRAGVWLALNLSDAQPAAYFVGSGQSLLRPVAICFGSGPDGRLTPADFSAAKAIAANWKKAANETDNWFDLRNTDLEDDKCECLFDLVFFATDHRGRARNDGQHFGTMFQRGNEWFPSGGVFTSLVPSPDPDGIPWGFLPRRSGRAEVPVFTLDMGDGGWTPVPAALKDHLDRIDPLPCKQKSGTPVKPITSTPASNEGEKAKGLTPA